VVNMDFCSVCVHHFDSDLLTVFYIYLHVASYKIINYCKKTDMRDIKKWYMSDEGNHMWVAELCGEVVGMVGLRHHEK